MSSWRLPLVGLAIGASWLAGCETDRSRSASCPPVVAYPRETLSRVADELDRLPADSAIERLLSDYAVLREQARACRP